MKEIRRLFAKSRVAISLDLTRKYLNGLYFHTIEMEGPEGSESSLCCVATDGFQLAKIDADAPEGAAEMDGVIIPERTVQEVVKILDDTDNQIEVSVSDTKIRFATPELMFTSRVVEGNFPDYTKLIPDSNPLELCAEVDELHKAVRRVTTISQQETRAVQLVIEEGQLSLSVTEPGLGTAEDEVLVSFPHPKLNVKFVHRHLLNVVTQIDTGKITFQFPNETGPTIVFGDADPKAKYVVMPVRV